MMIGWYDQVLRSCTCPLIKFDLIRYASIGCHRLTVNNSSYATAKFRKVYIMGAFHVQNVVGLDITYRFDSFPYRGPTKFFLGTHNQPEPRPTTDNLAP